MKTLAMFFAMAILITVTLDCGNVLAKESGKQSKACEMKFSELDSAHKGYLIPEDFRRELEGPRGQKKLLPYGKVLAEFSAADKNGDRIVTSEEFCDWDSHRK